jgi:hypothetical protein
MHVAEFLDALMLGPEVVKPLLPDVLREVVEQGSLSRTPGARNRRGGPLLKSEKWRTASGIWSCFNTAGFTLVPGDVGHPPHPLLFRVNVQRQPRYTSGNVAYPPGGR